MRLLLDLHETGTTVVVITSREAGRVAAAGEKAPPRRRGQLVLLDWVRSNGE
jgi:hypothetical protein